MNTIIYYVGSGVVVTCMLAVGVFVIWYTWYKGVQIANGARSTTPPTPPTPTPAPRSTWGYITDFVGMQWRKAWRGLTTGHRNLWIGMLFIGAMWQVACYLHMYELSRLGPLGIWFGVGVLILMTASHPISIAITAAAGVLVRSQSLAFEKLFRGTVKFQIVWFMIMFPLALFPYYMAPYFYFLTVAAGIGFWMFDFMQQTHAIRRLLKWLVVITMAVGWIAPFFPHFFVAKFDPMNGKPAFMTTHVGDELIPARTGWINSPESGRKLMPAPYVVIQAHNGIALLARFMKGIQTEWAINFGDASPLEVLDEGEVIEGLKVGDENKYKFLLPATGTIVIVRNTIAGHKPAWPDGHFEIVSKNAARTSFTLKSTGAFGASSFMSIISE